MNLTDKDGKNQAFLAEWPLDRLKNMTLAEYTTQGDGNCFIAWIEQKLGDLGSIWGGSAFKFGIYSRDNKDIKESTLARSYSDEYAWYTKLGNTEEEVFKKVRKFVYEVAVNAREGNIDAIDDLDTLGPAVKWKIAFHYQNLQAPTIVNVFKKAALIAFTKSDKNESYANLYKLIYQQKQNDESIWDLGSRVWELWESKQVNIWKMSHGRGEFTTAEINRYLDKKVITIGAATKKGQAKDFIEAPVGSLFYLCNSSDHILLIGQVTSESRHSNEFEEWIERDYRVVMESCDKDKPYTGINKGWSPNNNSTFKSVPEDEIVSFEQEILQPFFDITVDELLQKVELALPEENDVVNSEDSIDSELLKGIPLNQILFGPPGTGKTFSTRELAVKVAAPNWYANELEKNQSGELHQKIKDKYDELIQSQKIVFTTFHQSFSYEDFIEGIKATTHENAIQYHIENGIFKDMCVRAQEQLDEPFVFIIDEINRGNISKIFGELITLLEYSKRLGMDDEQSVTLPYSKKPFTVPKNVYVIGTMNTADKSLTHLDLALRRRFKFIELLPNYDLFNKLEVFGVKVGQLLETINARIEVLLDREHTIGHSYFIPLLGMKPNDQEKEIQEIFVNNIIPLLQEYFYDDYEKIALVLNDTVAQAIIQTKGAKLHALEKLFANQNIDSLFDRRYLVNTDAFADEGTYQRILGEYNS